MTLSKKKRIGFLLAMIGLAFGAVELAAFGAYRWWSGEWFGFARTRAAQEAVFATDPAQRTDAPLASAFGVTLHPYLGYVFDPAQLVGTGAGSSYGFVTADGPLLRRDPDSLIVAITGGSVAEMFGKFGAEEFARQLRSHPALADKRVRIVGLGLGGYKQPQQLLALNYLLAIGGEFDVLVNLDGFNEVALPATELVPLGINPFYPRGWQVLAADSADPAMLRRIGDVQAARARRVELAQNAHDAWWRFSVTANLLWALADRRAQQDLLRAQQRFERGGDETAGSTSARPFHAEGPHVEFADDDAMYDGLVRVWAESSLQMHRLCEANGIRYCHFLQPNQYDAESKPLSEEERRNAYRDDSMYRKPVAEGYPRLRAAGTELARRGVRFVDATRVFEGVEETLYIDSCCHFNERGNRLLAQRITQVVTADLDDVAPPDHGALLELRAEPSRVVLRAPFEVSPLRITGRFANGFERNLTYARTEFRSADPAIARVDAHGVVTAEQVGATIVHVTIGERSVEVPIQVTFDSVVSYGVGMVARPELAPRLRATIDASRHVEITLDEHEPGSLTTLLIGTRPERFPFCDFELLVPMLSSMHVPFVTDPRRGTFAFDVPLTAPKRTLFVQAILRDPRGKCGWLTSNALALTP